MLYETTRILAEQSYQHWITNEVFSFGWFVTMGVLATIYATWFALVDKSRLSHLLLLGSLSAVGFVIGELTLIQLLGVAEYKVRPLPFIPPLFIVSVTKAPILFMLVAQYTTSWKNYVLWAGIGAAALAFGLYPLYSSIGIFQLHNWNYFYQFLYMFTNGIIARTLFLMIITIEQSQTASKRVQEYGILQPAATKPLPEDQNNTDNQ